MDKEVNDINIQISKLNYVQKKLLYEMNFSMGYLSSTNLNERLVLVSLVALTYQKLKLKEPYITHLDILIKITKQPKDNSGFYLFLEALAIMAEDFSYGVKSIDACGLKTSQEIINKIKELLNTWIPF